MMETNAFAGADEGGVRGWLIPKKGNVRPQSGAARRALRPRRRRARGQVRPTRSARAGTGGMERAQSSVKPKEGYAKTGIKAFKEAVVGSGEGVGQAERGQALSKMSAQALEALATEFIAQKHTFLTSKQLEATSAS